MADNLEKINKKYNETKARFMRRFPQGTLATFECLRTRHFGRRYRAKGGNVFND